MNEGLKRVIDGFNCSACGAPKGTPCLRSAKPGTAITHAVHTARKLCPVCGQKYMERNGLRFRHYAAPEWKDTWCNARVPHGSRN